eukprot:TRINITY_DN1159_c0_g1_i2.p1 TRINITY_DN1159_c0_g1~~TRINITY_DN1159_c0_g1_i2.p1  ORF type:complete len:294 (+),score=63.48 TRINITY_DN1159_c0_g1_i2:121-1002(+)
MKASLIVSILLGLVAFACADSCVRNLYAYDPYYQSISLRDGFGGSTSQNFRPYNRDSAISYSQYYKNQITLSPQGSDRASFYDLGTNALFGYRYNVSLIGGNTAYSSIHVDTAGNIVYATSDVYNTDDQKAFQAFGPEVTSALQSMQTSASFYPQVGHIYLINTYSGQYSETYLTKMIVLDVSPDNATVTIRWDIIDATTSATRSSACFVSLDTSPRTGSGSNPNASATPLLAYNSRGLIIAFSVIVPVIFVMVVLLGVFVLVLFKRLKQVTGYSSYVTPMPKVDEKKPLIQK